MAKNTQNLTPHDSRHGGCDGLSTMHHTRTLCFPANHPAQCHSSAPVHTESSNTKQQWYRGLILHPFTMNDGSNYNSGKRTQQRRTANNGSWYKRNRHKRKYQKYRYTKTTADK